MADDKREVLIKYTVDTRQAVQATDKAAKSTENYSSATSSLTGQLDKMTGGLASTLKGIYSTIKGLKGLKVILASMGIGLIVIALASLQSAFTRISGPMALMEDVMGGISSVVGTLLDRFGLLGKALIQLFKGDFKGAAETAAKATKDLDDAISDAWDSGNDLSKMERDLLRATSDTNAEMAKRRDLIQQLRTSAREETEDLTKTRQLIEEAGRLEKENLEARIKLEEVTQAVINSRFEDSSKNYKDEIEQQDALSESQQRINAARSQEREFVLAIIDFRNNEAAQIKANADAEAKRINDSVAADMAAQERKEKQHQADLNMLSDFNQAELDALDAIDNAYIASQEKFRLADKNTYDEKQKQIKAAILAEERAKKATITGVIEVGALSAALFSEGGKAQATFSAAAAMASAWGAFITTMRDQPGGIFAKLAAGTAVLAAGLNAANTIKAAYAGSYAEGGWLQGASHTNGGINLNAEGGEFMVNKRSMANPYLASIVERINEAGNRQSFALGGFIGNHSAAQTYALNALPENLGDVINQQVPVLVTEDLDAVQDRIRVTEDRAILSR